jgi:hypothetical protein
MLRGAGSIPVGSPVKAKRDVANRRAISRLRKAWRRAVPPELRPVKGRRRDG